MNEGIGFCESCPLNTITNVMAATSLEDCICKPGTKNLKNSRIFLKNYFNNLTIF